MTDKDLQKILQIGIALSAEKDYNRLLEQILAGAMSLLHCDAGTLYLKNGEFLDFKILRNITMNTYLGGDGKPVGLPPVPITRENVCTLALLENRTICIDNVRECKEYDLSGPLRYDAMTGYHTQSILVVPLRDRADESVGVLQMINAKDSSGKYSPFPADQIVIIESIASQAAVAIQNMRYVEAVRELLYSFVRMMSAAIDERTPYNASHTRNMAEYGARFIDYLNGTGEKQGRYFFTEEAKEEFLMSVWLHDIGKLVTPLEVMNKTSRLSAGQRERILERLERFRLQLRIDCLEGKMDKEDETRLAGLLTAARTLVEKADGADYLGDGLVEEVDKLGVRLFRDSNGQMAPVFTEEERKLLTIRKGTLSEEERAVMENHAAITRKLLSKIKFPEEYLHVRDWAGSHHEFLNGTGYPQGLKADEISKEVRILTILDIFDALTAGDRPYKKGMPVEKAVSVLKSMADKEGKLDKELTGLFAESRCWEAK